MNFIDVDGKPIDGQSITIAIDHTVQSFHVVIRSLSGIHPDTLKTKLQEKWEVVECYQQNRKDYVKQ